MSLEMFMFLQPVLCLLTKWFYDINSIRILAVVDSTQILFKNAFITSFVPNQHHQVYLFYIRMS